MDPPQSRSPKPQIESDMVEESSLSVGVPPGRGLFCNRTLNLRSIKAIGYDMDYTLIHYHVEAWERRAYAHLKSKLLERGWPVQDLEFDALSVIRGLTIDTQLGNLVKANRFGYIKQAQHGTQRMDFDRQRRTYARTIVDLSEPRWVFLNTFFSVSEACMYGQLVELLDRKVLPEVLGYRDLYETVRNSLDAAHMEGALKAEIMANPDRFVEVGPELPLALLDQQRAAGKKLLLITNSEWFYTQAMMSYAIDRFLPPGMSWRDLFDVVIVSARKPSFFADLHPIFEVVDSSGLLRPTVGPLADGAVFHGGNAGLVESYLGVGGDEILYVGDHVYGDVHVSKRVRRWRTALVMRELEEEIRWQEDLSASQTRLAELMRRKDALESQLHQVVLRQRRRKHAYAPPSTESAETLRAQSTALREQLSALDTQAAPLAIASNERPNPHWGPLMRAGNDKSLLARHVERHADIYTSRASNFLFETPFVYLRSGRGTLPHDGAR